MYDGQRMMNGASGGVHPLLHNMQNTPMNQQPVFSAYGGGGGMEHGLEPQHTLPKVDQHTAWDTQLMMEEKLMVRITNCIVYQ